VTCRPSTLHSQRDGEFCVLLMQTFGPGPNTTERLQRRIIAQVIPHFPGMDDHKSASLDRGGSWVSWYVENLILWEFGDCGPREN